MYNNASQAGIASLLASRGRNGDSMLVHMTPGEVQGLQALALAHGGSLSINPETGLVEANFLKKLLPMIAGAVLNTVAPGVGSAIGGFFGATGTAASTIGTGLLVGGATALIEGDLKKGLMAGLGAYSGANIGQALQTAMAPTAAAATASPEQVVANRAAAANIVGATPEAVTQAQLDPVLADLGINVAAPAAATTVAAAAPAAPTGLFGRAGDFYRGLGGGAETPMGQNIARYVTLSSLGEAMTPEYKMPGTDPLDDLVYMPGERNPLYGTGRDQPYYLPGKYYRRTPQGLVETDPYKMAPKPRGFATGGPVQPEDQYMNQPRSIPHPYQPFPYPNQNYPLSTVTQGNYSPGMPQSSEMLSGYEPQVDTYTGEEQFAEGGSVGDDDRVYPPAEPGGTLISPFSAGAASAEEAKRKFEEMLYGPPPPPRDIQPMMDYLAKLNEQARKPIAAPPPAAPSPPPPPPPPYPPGGGGEPPDDRGGPIMGGPILGSPVYGGGPGYGGPVDGGGSGLPPGYKPGIGAGGEPFTGTNPFIDENFPVKPDPDTPALVDEALGNKGPIDVAKDKFMEWFNKRFTDPYGVVGTAIGMTGAGMLGTYVWDLLTPTVKNFFVKTEPLTPEEAALAEAEAKKAAEAVAPPPADTPAPAPAPVANLGGGSGGGTGGMSLAPAGPFMFYTPYSPTYSTSVTELTEEEAAAEEAAKQSRAHGGRIKAMQTGGIASLAAPAMPVPPVTPAPQMPMPDMEPPNPFGAAVGEDYNFGFAAGGMPGEYRAGGKLLNGPGDGMSDDIPAVIRGKGVQRAALADGEFVIPADVVSHLGNGSTNAGAKKLYKMMAQVRQARTGKAKQAPAVKMDKYLPA